MKIETKDKIVQRVLKKMDERSKIGQAKYGSTMHDEITTGKKDLGDFLTDVQEEIMDALLYIEAAKTCLQEEIEECYVIDKDRPVEGCANQCDPSIYCECVKDVEDDRYWKHDSSHPISNYP